MVMGVRCNRLILLIYFWCLSDVAVYNILIILLSMHFCVLIWRACTLYRDECMLPSSKLVPIKFSRTGPDSLDANWILCSQFLFIQKNC